MHRLARILLGLIAVAFLAYGAGEVYLRLGLSPPPDPSKHLYLWPPLLREEYAVSRAVPGLEPRRTVFTTNSRGLRGDENDPADDGTLRVVTLGGSVTECLLLGDEDAWPHVAQERLAEASGRPVWVGNAGKSGQMTLDYVAHVRLLLPQFRPHVVVVMPGGNDLQAAVEDRLMPLDLRPLETLTRYARPLYVEPSQVLPVERALEPSHAWFFFQRSRGRQGALDLAGFYEKVKKRRYEASKLDTIPDLEEHLATYRANLEQLVDAMSALPGARLVLMTHPSLWKPDLTDAEERALWAGYTCLDCDAPRFYSRAALQAAIEAFNRTLLEVCAARQLSCLDVASGIPRDLEHFYDDAHLREAGSRKLAELLADHLVREGLAK